MIPPLCFARCILALALLQFRPPPSTLSLAPYSRIDPTYLTFLLQDCETDLVDDIIPHDVFGFKAVRGSDPDMPTFAQAMASPQHDYWIEALKAELSELETRETWIEIHVNELPEGANVVPGTWALKIRCVPDGRFHKFKAGF
jgi:hypothetical protein